MAERPSRPRIERGEASRMVFFEDNHCGLWSPEKTHVRRKSLATGGKTQSKPFVGDSHCSLWSPVDTPVRTQSRETGYESAPYMSDLLTTTEGTSDSTIWTSDEPEEARLRPARLLQKVHSRIPEKCLESSESTKSDEPGDTSTIRHRKKPSVIQRKATDPSAQIQLEGPSSASRYEMPESITADAAGCSTIKGAEGGISSGRTKSRFASPKKAIMSVVSKIVSPMKQTRPSRVSRTPTDSRKQKNVAESLRPTESSRKSPSKRTSATSVSKSPARREAMTPLLLSVEGRLQAEQPRSSSKHGAISKIFASPGKRRGQLKVGKSPRKQHETSEAYKELGSEACAPPEIPLESPETPIFERMKRFPCASARSCIKQREAADSQKAQTSTSGEQLSDSRQVRSSYYSLVEGMKNMELNISPRKGKRGGSDEVPLSAEAIDIDDPEESKQGTSRSEVKNTAAKQTISVVSRRAFKSLKSSLKNRSKYDVESPSTADEPLTDVSSVSGSSGLDDASERKQRNVSSFHSVSLISLLEEDAGAGSSDLREKRKRLQRQKRVEAADSPDSDEDARAARAEFDSPCKIAAHERPEEEPKKK